MPFASAVAPRHRRRRSACSPGARRPRSRRTPDTTATTSTPTSASTTTTTAAPTTTRATTTTTRPEPSTTATTTRHHAAVEQGRRSDRRRAPIVAVGQSGGDATAQLQQRLLDLGFWLSGADGSYGLTTQQAVMAFQKYKGLPASGSVDQATADALTQRDLPCLRSRRRRRPRRDRQDPPGALPRQRRQGGVGVQHVDGQRRGVHRGRPELAGRDASPTCPRHPTGCGPSSVSARRAGGRAISARSTDRSTSSVVSPCTARTASPTTPPRTGASGCRSRRWTSSGTRASCRSPSRCGCTAQWNGSSAA